MSLANLHQIQWRKFTPSGDFYDFKPKDLTLADFYKQGFGIKELFGISSTGVQSSRDQLVVSCDYDDLQARMRAFCDASIDTEVIRTQFFKKRVQDGQPLGDSSFWTLQGARNQLRAQFNEQSIRRYLYLPFDARYIYYDKRVIHRPRDKVFKHFINGDNIALVVGRQGGAVGNMAWNLAYATTDIVYLNVFYRGGGTTFPLFLFGEQMGIIVKESNLAPEIVQQFTKVVGETTPELIFNYTYAVLHSPSYRQKFGEFLERDFPRIPYPTNADSFLALAELGARLVSIHTMKDFPEAADVAFNDADGYEVNRRKWIDGKVFINKASCFTCVEQEVFQHYIGGFQPLSQWLKDRTGRKLTDKEISHFKRMVQALRRTRELMAEIDRLPLPWM